MRESDLDPAPRPTLLVTGGSSFLGRHLVAQALPRWRVIATFWSKPGAIPPALPASQKHQLDLRNETEVARFFFHHQPDVIIHTAGSNRPRDYARLIVEGTRHVAAAAARLGARLINLSTDVVFDGKHAPYREQDPPAPLHPYGRAKAVAESIVVASEADAVTIRTSLIYSLTGEDHSTGWLLQAPPDSEPATLFTDEYRSPISVWSLAASCLELAEHPYQGLLHVAGAQSVNRWQLGNRLLEILGIDRGSRIRPGPTPPSLREQRPQNCTLDISLAQSLLRTPLPGLDEVCAQELASADS